MILNRMLTTGRLEYSAARFTGSSTILLRGANLTGASDGKQITISVFYFPIAGGAGSLTVNSTIFSNMTTGVEVEGMKLTPGASGGLTGKVQFHGQNSTGDKVVVNASTTTMSTGNWYHLLLSFDASDTAKRHIYVSDVAQTLDVTSYANINVDWTTGNFAIGCIPTGSLGNNINARMTDLWIDDTYLDITSSAVRRKFITAAGKPTILGAAGQNPTGSAPLVYFRDFDDFSSGHNRGTGGDFSVTGAVTEEEGPW
jgi:hypothetical protein